MEKNLQTLNQEKKLAVWAERISACRNSGQGVKSWCRENHICEATFYKWQRKVFELVQTQQVHFTEITPQPQPGGNIAVTVRVAGAEAEIYSGADAQTVELVLRVLQSSVRRMLDEMDPEEELNETWQMML